MFLGRAVFGAVSKSFRKTVVAGGYGPLGVGRQHIIVRNFAASSKFEEAQARLKTLREEPDNDVKLKIYALFKQATVGDVNIPKPGSFDFVGKAKWAAWKSVEGTPKEQAESQYIQLINELVGADSQNKESQTMEETAGLVLTRKDGVLTIRLNRPSKKNSISFDMYKEITRIVKEAADDTAVNYLVLTGTDDFFSSGNDIGNFIERIKSGGDLNDMAKDAAKLVLDYIAVFIDFPKPMIALVNGPAIGVSCTILGLFDLVYASDSAWFQTPFSKLGLSPEGCSSVTFPRLLGGPLAADLLFLNRKLTAAEAKNVGFITDVFPAAQFEAETSKKIEYLTKQPPKSLMYSKILLREPMKEILHKANADECERLVERFTSDEAMKAVMAFFKSKGSSKM